VEFLTKEMQALAEVVVRSEIQELNELQLALIGGGIGETVL
jgi:hypothetical protein